MFYCCCWCCCCFFFVIVKRYQTPFFLLFILIDLTLYFHLNHVMRFLASCNHFSYQRSNTARFESKTEHDLLVFCCIFRWLLKAIKMYCTKATTNNNCIKQSKQMEIKNQFTLDRSQMRELLFDHRQIGREWPRQNVLFVFELFECKPGGFPHFNDSTTRTHTNSHMQRREWNGKKIRLKRVFLLVTFSDIYYWYWLLCVLYCIHHEE
jgi:hypothetical protein